METPSVPAPPIHVPLNKMGPQDDPEAFLDLFERSVEACGWPRLNWPVRLIPLLFGEVQIASSEPPGVRRPETSHPSTGRP